jgi:hypothetical protein
VPHASTPWVSLVTDSRQNSGARVEQGEVGDAFDSVRAEFEVPVIIPPEPSPRLPLAAESELLRL